MLIGLEKDMTSIDFWFTRFKVKVTRLIILITIYHIPLIFHMLIGLDRGMTPLDIGKIRLKVRFTMVTFVKCFCSFSWELFITVLIYFTCLFDFIFLRSRSQGSLCKKCCPLIFLRTIFHRAFISFVLIGLSEDKTFVDFGFTRSKSQGSLFKKNVNKVFANYLENCLSQSFQISHADWSWWGHESWCFQVH